ncbi:hypothetical protein MMC26_005251 [Xylographa opegraphella]|nr:hypothetical protein [Xylographa opegraphella]
MANRALTPKHVSEHGNLSNDNSNELPRAADNTHSDPAATIDEQQVKLYDTPPQSYSEAVDPLTSRKDGKLRAESLGISASAGRGHSASSAAVPTMASQQKLPYFDGAGSQPEKLAVPRPNVTREPNPCVPPLSIAQRLEGQAVRFSETRDHNVPALRLDQGHLPRFNTSFVVPGPVQASESPGTRNPYADRADEIGPAHGIPGVGHLGNLLTPPGWVEGMSPFDTKQVNQLYDMARKKARETLAANAVNLESLTPQERATKEKERDKKWETELRLEKILLMERLAVYQAQGVSPSKIVSGQVVAQGSDFHATLDPSLQNSIPYQHDTFRPEMPTLFQPNYGPMTPSLQTVQAQAQFGPTHVGFANPTALDPRLAKESLEMVVARHAHKKDNLLRELWENDRWFDIFLANNGYQFSQGPISREIRAPVLNQHNDPFQVGRAIDPRAHLRPHSYVSPTVPNFGNSQMMAPAFNNMTQSFPAGPDPSRYGRGDATLHGHPNNMAPNFISGRNENLQMYNVDSGTNEPLDGRTTNKKKRAPRKKPEAKKEEKLKPWYHDQMAQADLPTSALSADAMQAGIDFGTTGVKAKQSKANTKPASSAPKKRRRKDVNTTVEGFQISKDHGAKMLEAYNNGTMHPGMKVVWETARGAGRLDNLLSPMTSYSPYNDQANISDVNHVNPTGPHGYMLPGSMESRMVPRTANPFAHNPVMSNQDLENRWQPVVPSQAYQVQHTTGSTNITPWASNVRRFTNANAGQSSQFSTATSTEHDDENDPTFEMNSSRIEGAASNRNGPATFKRKALSQTAGTKRPRPANASRQIDGAIDLTSSSVSTQKN